MIKREKTGKNSNEVELGFGNKNYQKNVRFLNKDGSVNIKRKINQNWRGFDVYHWLITTSWLKFISLVFFSYIVVNTIFACIYFFIGAENYGGLNAISSIEKFSQLFFFSAQTLTTVGYGHIYPDHVFASSVSAIESMLGLMGFALVTGLLYGRFSRPKAHIVYSDNALISPYKEGKAFMFRVANTKQNELIEIECQLVLAINNKDTKKREFHFLNLERNKINFLPFTWTIVHPIDENSPLLELSKDELEEMDAEFIILIKGINDTYFQNVYSRTSYKSEDIVWDAKFIPMKQNPEKDGSISIYINELHHFNQVEI
jgi:inward rectifier potassium channel